ncbi:MAG TPA: hypothetical protein VG245_06415 [Candidatus Dormibacteraeota bacterium]|jgi:hypothetical protein|nr:hypothetical protein [Candidatus Dormibacteraeota bacterium]
MSLARPTPASLPAEPDPRPSPIHWQTRLLEIAPGAVTWVVIALPLVLALTYPLELVAAVLVLDVYWLIRSVMVVLGIRGTFARLRQEMRIDWWQRCQDLPAEAWTDPDGAAFDPRQLYHCALIPTYTEKYEVLQATVQAWADAIYPADRKIVAIITRTTDHGGIENVGRLQEEYAGRFHRFWHILDPVLPGVVVGKSAAMAYAGPVLNDHIAAEGLDPRRVIVTDLDSDFRIHAQYMGRVSHEYAQDRQRDFRIYQPIPMFHNNIWRVPAVVHVLASAATQWQMFLHSRPYRLVTFASYSMSMQLVRDVGYWDPHVIQEDSRFFWRAFFRYGARLQVRPVCLPIYGDCPRSKTYAGTHASQYNQIKRWAWGVSDIPFVFLNMVSHPEIPFWKRAYRFALLEFNHLTWVAMPLLIFFAANVPSYFRFITELVHWYFPVAYDYSITTLSSSYAYLSAGILTVTLANVAMLIYIDESLVPARPSDWPAWRRAKSYVEIVAYPIIGIIFSVLPALESQTRLMLGRYLEYRVTEKE